MKLWLTINRNHYDLGLIISICEGLGFKPSFHEDRDLMLAGQKALCFKVSEFLYVVQWSFKCC